MEKKAYFKAQYWKIARRHPRNPQKSKLGLLQSDSKVMQCRLRCYFIR